MSTRVAFVGAGGIASLHLDHLAEMDDVAVVAVCDVDESTARTAAQPHGAATFTDPETLFEEAVFDALFVCVPPFVHGPPELLAAEHGVDLFVEKPLGLTRETASEILDAVRSSGIVTQVGHMNRYADVTTCALEIIDGRAVAVASGHWLGGVPSSPWWGTKERSGGQVVEQSTHIFDILRYFVGDVGSVSAFGGQQVVTDEIDFEDATVASLRHRNGTVSQVVSTSASPDGGSGLEVVGDGFHLDIDFRNGHFTGTADGDPVEYRGDDGAERFRREVRGFIDAVQTGDCSQPRSPYADAVETFELTLAVEEALHAESVVEVR